MLSDMAKIVPFVSRKGAPLALTEARLLHIARLQCRLKKALQRAYEDLECGMPYLGTTLRLSDERDLPVFVVDAAENVLRSANAGT